MTNSEIPPRYLETIRGAAPGLAIASARMDLDGLVNDVVIVNEEWVFRFPKNEPARLALEHEARLLALVRPLVDLPTPEFQMQAGFVAYRLIPGRALLREDIFSLPESDQDRLAETLALFLGQLHSIPAAQARAAGVGASDAERSREDWLEMYAQAERELFPLLMAHARQWVERHFAPLLDGSLDLSCDPVLTHGDLGPYHLLYDPAARQINGVIDFGTGGLGDPANDFAAIINDFGETFLHRMARYNPHILPALDRARFWAGTLEIQWVLGGLRTGDLSWFAVHIGRARDTFPYGYRIPAVRPGA